METSMDNTLVVGPRINVAAMADIVQALVVGAEPGRDARWLRERATAADLEEHACAALEALRARLHEGGTVVVAGLWGMLPDGAQW